MLVSLCLSMMTMTIRQMLYFFFLGCAFATLLVFVGSALNAPALARWEVQTQDHDTARAWLAIIGIRHLPMFLLSCAIGYAALKTVKNTRPLAALTLVVPYMLYVFLTSIAESLELGEPAFSWLHYEPGYFIWPHFVFVPAGVFASYRMVHK